jgi:hypothetical protein
MKKAPLPPDYEEITNENEAQFETVLESLSPKFFYVYKSIKENKIDPSVVMEIVYKVGLAQQLDDGFGKIYIDVQNRSVQRIKLIQDMIVKPTKEEKEM